MLPAYTLKLLEGQALFAENLWANFDTQNIVDYRIAERIQLD